MKHGMSETRLYKTWENMKIRCNNPNAHNYHNYGGRGIKVCPEWFEFIPFMKWAMANGYADNLTLDRMDVNGDYEPSNCRWTTVKEQQNNMRNTVYITINEITDTLSNWSEKSGLDRKTIYGRYKYLGWTGEKLLKPSQKGER